MKYVFQFCRILFVCLLGEILAAILPLPVPASVYGLILLLAALRCGILKLSQVKETGYFLVGLLPLLFVTPAAGVMELWDEIGSMLLPCILAVLPVTWLVIGVTGRVTQMLQQRKNR